MLYLKEIAKQDQQFKMVTVTERFPQFIVAPCDLNVMYQVEAKDDFYLVHLHASGMLHLQCQRCLDVFNYLYNNKTVIAVCRDDARAEQILERYECIVSPNFQINLDDLVIDELHLYAPQVHPEIIDCSSEINQFLTEKNEPS